MSPKRRLTVTWINPSLISVEVQHILIELQTALNSHWVETEGRHVRIAQFWFWKLFPMLKTDFILFAFYSNFKKHIFQDHSDHFSRKWFGATHTPPVGCVWHLICGTGSRDCIVSLLWYKCTYMNSWGTLLRVSLNFILFLNHTREAYLKQDFEFQQQNSILQESNYNLIPPGNKT